MSDKSYNLVQPSKIDNLLHWDKYHQFAIPILHWLIPLVYKKLGSKLNDVEITVVKACYHGCYPTLGLIYKGMRSSTGELETLVKQTCDELIGDETLLEFILFVSQDDKDWFKINNEIMS